MAPCFHVSLHWWQWHPPVGLSVGILAFLGVLVPLFRPWDKIAPRERATWTFLMFFFLIFELRTLYLDRAEHDEDEAFARCEELESFGHIASTLQTAITSSQEQFAQTMGGVGKVFEKTQVAAETANEAVKSITGADAWGWVWTTRPPSSIPKGYLELAFSNEGNYTMRTVKLAVVETAQGGAGAKLTLCDVGDVAPHYKGVFTPCMIKPEEGKQAEYLITISAENGSITELLKVNTTDGTLHGSVFRTRSNGNKKILKTF